MPHTLIDTLLRRRESSDTLYSFQERSGDESLGYAALYDDASSVAALLQSEFAPRSVGLLLFPAGLDFIRAFFGMTLANMVSVPTPLPKPNRPLTHVSHIALDCQASFVLCAGADFDRLRDLFIDTPLGRLPWINLDDRARFAGPDWRRPSVTDDLTVLLQYTSGSTGTPRGIPLSHRNLLGNLEAIRLNFGHSSASRGVIWLPPYHDMGLIGGLLEPLYVGFPVLLFSPFQFLLHPIKWLQAISDFRASTSGGPNFAYDYCVSKISEEQKSCLDLSCWQVAFVGAEPIQAATLKRFETAFRAAGFASTAWHPCYGLAEATLLVSAKTIAQERFECCFDQRALEQGAVQAVDATHAHARTLVSCGLPAQSTAVRVIHPHDQTECAEGCVGEIDICGPGVSAIGDGGPPFRIRSGDLGFFWRGELFLCGRLKEMLIFKGRNFFPQDIELSIQNSHVALEIHAGAAFSVEDPSSGARLVIIQELRRQFRQVDKREVVQNIRRALAIEHDLQAETIVLVPPGTIPRTSSGKIRRIHARDQYLERRFEPHIS